MFELFPFHLGRATPAIEPGVAEATAAAIAPSVSSGATVVIPSAAEATATAIAPSVSSGAVVVAPGVGSATATAVPPGIGYPKAVEFAWGAEPHILFDEFGFEPTYQFRFETRPG